MNETDQPCVCIVAGGTGGHISPGIALYEAFREAECKPIVLSGKRDMRFSSLRLVAEGDLVLYRAPSFSRNLFKIIVFPAMFLAAVMAARSLMRRRHVRAVIGMGGYVSAPALVAAKMLKIPFFLCEQNSVPGKVTRFFEKDAAGIFGTFAGTTRFLKAGGRYLQVGNPIRRNAVASVRAEEARKAFHLAHSKHVVLVIGGSQGARRLNELIYGMKTGYRDELSNVGIIWSTGDLSYEEYKEKMYREIGEGSIYLSPFIEQVGLAYQAADLAIARAGAGVMMELAAMGLPSILVPYPYAADNHQERNADEFVEAGAAVKISDKDAVPDKVMPILVDLLHNPRALQRMSRRARSLARLDAAERIVKDIMNRLRESKSDESGA